MSRQGFSLIEVIIFAAIVSVFFVMVLSMSTASLSTLKTNERRTYATRYAEETMEWLGGEKSIDWDTTFLPKAPLTTPTVYCFNSTTLSWPAAGSCGSSFTLGGMYRREVALSRQANATPGDFQVTAVVTVSWQQGAGTMSVPVSIIFNKFE